MSEKTNLELWNKVRTPDPQHTKGFKRGGGFTGTSTNVTYLVRLATEQFGVNGVGWGFDVDDEKYVEGAPLLGKDNTIIGNEIIHVVRGRIWYMHDGEKRHTSPQFGQTTFVGSNKYGAFTDEEAPKKSISDCMVKCLSLLGFAADIHLGLWDDNKYLAEVTKRFAETPQTTPSAPESKPLTDQQEKNVILFKEQIEACKDSAELKKWWADNNKKVREVCGDKAGMIVYNHYTDILSVLDKK